MSIVLTTPEELRKLISETVKDEVTKALQAATPDTAKMKLYSQNQVRAMLRIGHGKLKQLIEAGQLHTTSDGKISHEALTSYIKNS